MNFREAIGWKLLKMSSGKPSGERTRIEMKGSRLCGKHLCIVLPPDFDNFELALRALPEVVRRIGAPQTTVWVRDNFRTWISSDLPIRLHPYQLQQVDWFFRPSHDVLHQMSALDCDLIIDMSPTATLYTSALVAASRAGTRVALSNERNHHLCNLLIHADPQRSLSERYDVLLTYL